MQNFNKMVSILYLFFSLVSLLLGGYVLFTNMTKANILIAAFGMAIDLLVLGIEQGKQDG
jgi:hypothetical protein